MTVAAPIKHSRAVWELLLANAKTEIIEIPLTDDKIECLVFRGRIGEIFDLAGVSKAYYSKVRAILTDCGAITMLVRGTTHSPSVLVLDVDKPPPDELPENVKIREEALTTAQGLAKIDRRVEVIEQRLGGIEIVEALRNLELRLSAVESKTGDRRENGKNTVSEE